MKNEIKNTLSTISITPLFYQGVPSISGDESINQIPFDIQDFADICIEATYVLDFFKRRFHFVANRHFFLCGHDVAEVLSSGYDFFQEVIYSEDLALLANMHSAILQRLCTMDKPEEISYFSFAVRIKSDMKHQMVDHKLRPIYINGKLRFGLCLMACSVFEKPGHLNAYYCNGMNYDEFSTKERKWISSTVKQLTMQEKKVLIGAKQGFLNIQIADKISIEHQSVRNIEHSIFQKLQVNSIVQAINIATNNHMIFKPEQNVGKESKKLEEETTSKRTRQPITPEMIAIIQESIDKGNLYRPIAKQLNISEGTIRYNIKIGKLKENQCVKKSRSANDDYSAIKLL